jgi:hypothetical protein
MTISGISTRGNWTRRGARYRKHAYAPRAPEDHSSAAFPALFAFVSPAHASASAANTYDNASRPSVAGDDPVNSSDPTGEWANICHGLLWIGWAASPFLCALGSGIATLPGPTLYRLGQSYEDAAVLQADATKAQAGGLPFGVSVLDRRPSRTNDYSTANTSAVEEVFHLAKTGKSEHHYTLVLPNPVTAAVARTYNRLFGRRPPTVDLSAYLTYTDCPGGIGGDLASQMGLFDVVP